MRGNSFITMLVFSLILVTLNSFTNEDLNHISKKNVTLTLPDYFPEPIYKFENNEITPEGFVLGRMLFHDPILSKDSTVSCASCHQQFAAFAHIDHELSHGIEDRIGIRNVPALQNLIWKDNFMWDGGVKHLEDQFANPITNPDEMGESLTKLIQKLERNDEYKQLFNNAFGDTLVSSEKIFKSLAQFTGLMISANSKYDQYLKAEIEFTASEKRGLELFNLKCNNCHTTPLFTNNEFENNGLAFDSALNDLGRGDITKEASDNHKFKIPSLRNIQLTFPYMHDGRIKNLKQVLDHYGNLSEEERNQNPKLEAIGMLTESDKQNLMDFMFTLTDKTFLLDRRFGLIR